RHRVVEVELRGELESAARTRLLAHLEVDVHGSPPGPARIDRAEAGDPARVRDLVSAQELLARGVEARVPDARVHAPRIAVPDVDQRARDRCAGAGGAARDAK